MVSVPNHLGLIVDGNRRWAREHNLPTLEGHKAGLDNLKEVVKYAFDHGVQVVSAFIFSTENWERSKEEVGYLMDLFVRTFTKEAESLVKENIKIVVLGDRTDEKVPKKVAEACDNAEEKSRNNTGGTLAFCFNYGGLEEIAQAVRNIVASGKSAEEVTQKDVMNSLYHPEIPPVDLLIRTSGEMRISNFMLPRMAYAELYFSKKNWPDFSKEDLKEAFEDFANRQRRHGK